MDHSIKKFNGIIQQPSSYIRQRILKQKLFGLSSIQENLFNFCKSVITASEKDLESFDFYDLLPSVLLYGPPNTGKTTLCHFLFDRLKCEVTNEINFYLLDIGDVLSPELGQSSRNLTEAFVKLKRVCETGSSVFLLLDELDTFCMSRSRVQEHDAIRRAMTTLMLELDSLKSLPHRKLLIFGITNVYDLIDTAIVRRFSIKQDFDIDLKRDDFDEYVQHLGKPLHLSLDKKELEELYDIYQHRQFNFGDLKSIFKEFFIQSLALNSQTKANSQAYSELLALFNSSFSTKEHLKLTEVKFDL
jgi:SpoVK/Ycf46/Vps4 family AAA+-type ATPase